MSIIEDLRQAAEHMQYTAEVLAHADAQVEEMREIQCSLTRLAGGNTSKEASA